MPLAPLGLSPDLARLIEEGYEVQRRGGFLLIHHVPYLTETQAIEFGTLIAPLTLAGDVTAKPGDHVVYFQGSYPYRKNGSRMDNIIAGAANNDHGAGVSSNFTLSSRPLDPHGFPDFYEKMTSYSHILSAEAISVDPTVAAKTGITYDDDDPDGVFNYFDSSVSRADIGAFSEKLAMNKVAIVGLGGTGSYILDLVAKTPVRELHIFDGDIFLQHNAFRSPGAASIEELRKKPLKVDYLVTAYSKMRKGVLPHPYAIGADNIDELHDMNFVFLSMDTTPEKRLIVQKLEEFGIAFIDVGLGVDKRDGVLSGLVRATLSTPDRREHVWERQGISFHDPSINNEYEKNIQIADLNALNAALCVIKWKKYCGYYEDFESEDMMTYNINGNCILNERRSE